MVKLCKVIVLILFLSSSIFGQVPITRVLQSAQTTGNGTAFLIDSSGRNFVIAVEWSVGVTAGVITIEEALTIGYTGTWSTLATVSWVAADTTELVHLAGSFSALRARISTTVDNGTVTVSMKGI